MMLTRRQLPGLGAASFAALPLGATNARSRWLRQVNQRWVVSTREAIRWHEVKDAKGAALTGNESWRQFLRFLELKLNEYGCVDIHRSAWPFTRLETRPWPDDSSWSLAVNGRRVPLANFGANCGLTGPDGVCAPLVMWDPMSKPDVAGKIVVYRPAPRQDVYAAGGRVRTVDRLAHDCR